jgi:hypothetical protein
VPGTNVLNRFDYNRDGTVSVIDQLLARNNLTTTNIKLQQITVPGALFGSGLVAQGLGDSSSDIARGLALSSLSGSSSSASVTSSAGTSAASDSRLQPQALSAAYGEGESLLGKRRAVATAADDVDGDLLELLVTHRS